VVLHKNLNDSAVKKLKPEYYTTMDSIGNFRFRFLETGTYNVYVLPNDYTKKYDDSTKIFAFYDHPLIVGEGVQSIMLYAYNEYPPDKNNNSFSEAPVSTSSKKKPVDTTTSIKFMSNSENEPQDLLNDLVINFPKPVAHFDSSKISFMDTNFHAITNYRIIADSSFSSFSLKYPWKENQYFKLIVQKDAFIDSTGKMLAKDDTINIKTNSESAYGSIRLRFSNLDLARNPVLQLIENDRIVDSVALTQTEFYRRLYKPGDYSLRILYDDDKNMSWTPGNFALKRQPEIAVRIPRRITIKKNWDNEININL
jgi:hypothetical protein